MSGYALTGGRGGFRAGRDYLLYSASQLVSCLGDAFQAVAAAVLLYEFTGSGLAAGVGAIFPLLSGMFLSPFAGFLGDRVPMKKLLIITGLAKGLAVMLFAAAGSLWQCYGLIFLISVINVFYGIPGRKITAFLLPGKDLLVGNSLLSGLSGAAFFAGPAAAGLAVGAWGAGESMILCGALYILSSLFIPFLALPKDAPRAPAAPGAGGVAAGIWRGCRYCLGKKELREVAVAFAAVAFGSASTNMAFYSYSFDILKTDAAQWGVIVSVFNGVILLSTALSVAARRGMGRPFRLLVFLPCLGIASAWLCYSLVGSFAAVLPALALEGTCYYFIVTLLTTRLQLSSERNNMARALGSNDMLVNAARFLGIGSAWAIMHFVSVPAVFAANAALLFVFSISELCAFAWGNRTISRSGSTPYQAKD